MKPLLIIAAIAGSFVAGMSTSTTPPPLEYIVDSTSTTTITIREKYGPTIVVDSVTLVLIKDNRFYVTRARKAYGVFPLSNYAITERK